MVFPVSCGRAWLVCTEPWPQPHPTPFRMNWNADCEPDLITQHVKDLTNAPEAKWEKIPAAKLQKVVKCTHRRVEAVFFTLTRVTVRCPHIFSHEVYTPTHLPFFCFCFNVLLAWKAILTAFVWNSHIQMDHFMTLFSSSVHSLKFSSVIVQLHQVFNHLLQHYAFYTSHVMLWDKSDQVWHRLSLSSQTQTSIHIILGTSYSNLEQQLLIS